MRPIYHLRRIKFEALRPEEGTQCHHYSFGVPWPKVAVTKGIATNGTKTLLVAPGLATTEHNGICWCSPRRGSWAPARKRLIPSRVWQHRPSSRHTTSTTATANARGAGGGSGHKGQCLVSFRTNQGLLAPHMPNAPGETKT